LSRLKRKLIPKVNSAREVVCRIYLIIIYELLITNTQLIILFNKNNFTKREELIKVEFFMPQCLENIFIIY